MGKMEKIACTIFVFNYFLSSIPKIEKPLSINLSINQSEINFNYKIKFFFQTSQVYATTFDDNIVQIDYNSDGIKFVLTDRVCGIEIKELDQNLHDGNWKCHIAETNKKPSGSDVVGYPKTRNLGENLTFWYPT